MAHARLFSLVTLSALACGQPTGRDEAGTSLEGVGSNDEVEASADGATSNEGETAEGATGDDDDAPDGDPDDDDDADGSQPKWDVLGIPDGGGGNCGVMDPNETHSYIWIANSSQSTVSKINTQTLVEEARYYTRGDNFGNPSRTSVALSGNVAVANRSGGVAKFYSNIEDCPDTNGQPGIQTSSGPTICCPSARTSAWPGTRPSVTPRSDRSRGRRATSTRAPASTRTRSCGRPAAWATPRSC